MPEGSYEMGVIKPILPSLIQGVVFRGHKSLWDSTNLHIPSPLWLGHVCSTGLSRENHEVTESPKLDRTHQDHRVQHQEVLAEGESERDVTQMRMLGLEPGSQVKGDWWSQVKGDSSSDTSQSSRDVLRSCSKECKESSLFGKKEKKKIKEKNL